MGCSPEPLEIERGIWKAAILAIFLPVAPSQNSSENINDPRLEALAVLSPLRV